MADENGQPPDEAKQHDAEPDRMAQPVDTEQPPRLPFPVVGIGASAGGVEAVSEFLSAMPPDTGMAFILVQHLPPDHESLLAEVLARRTTMSVRQVEDGMVIEPNNLYVIRPGHVLSIREGQLHLGPELGGPRAANRPIDDFFRSLAEEQRERAICVVMSGMGSNGTAGAQAIKAVGGLCVAQDPDSAQYPSMPRHLIDAGYADYIARPAELPEVLRSYAGSPYASGGREADAEAVLDREGQALREILAILRTRSRQDFSGYKKPTLLRRVQRRMGLARAADLAEYARILRQSPTEVTALADDLLIHVTGFFRDPEAWEALRMHVVVPLVESRESGGVVRAWVTACSSGEEAYSLAMLLVEEADRVGKRLDIKVFATDLADRTLAHARAGVYPGGIESEISPERLRRFFQKEDEVYRVRPDLRDRVVFAPQNVLQDPPFSRLDIACCRNLLIYLEPAVQMRVLSLLHFGVREGGALFLGTSETVAGAEELFEAIDKKARIFRRVGVARHGTLELLPYRGTFLEGANDLDLPGADRLPVRRVAGGERSLGELTRHALLESHTPPAVTVDRDSRIVYYHGDTTPFLLQLSGDPTRDLTQLAREGVRGAIRAALHQASSRQQRVAVPDGWVDLAAGRRVRVTVTASPARSTPAREMPDFFVVSFEERGEFPRPLLPAAEGEGEEVNRLRAELQSTIEELQTSNEELKASNEEVMSVNEELQSANEELETSKEEMQSLNEELRSVNAQLRAKMEEHQSSSSDLTSLLASTDIAVLFLDRDFRIRRYTPALRKLVDLIPADLGRPLSALARKFEDPELDEDCLAVLEQLIPAEREVAGAGGRYYLRRVLPYRTVEDRIDGLVVTFVDISIRKQAEEALRASEEQFRRSIEDAPIPVIMQAEDGQVLQVSRTWTDLTGYTLAEVPTMEAWLTRAYGPGADAVRTHMRDLFKGDRKTLDVEFALRTRRGAERRWSFSASAPGTLRDGRRFLVGMAVDVTDRLRAQEELRASEERLRLSLESATDFAIMTMDPDRVVASWSPGAEAVFGYPAAEMVGQSVDLLFTPEDRASGAPEEEAGQARRRGRAADERWHLRKDGTRFYASGVLTPLGNPSRGFVKVLRDLTARKRMEDELRQARDELERRVDERTTELSAALESLESEMERRAELARRLVTVQEDERRRVARDLHDTVGQTLTGLSLALAGVANAGPMSEAATERLAQGQRLAADLGRELHEVAVQLRPTALDDLGLEAAMRALAEEWSRRTGLPVEIQASGVGRFPPEVETALYRVVQEALTNVARHAGASRTSVVLARRDAEAVTVVEDDGSGFDPNAVRTPAPGRRAGVGLAGMRERVGLLGGTVEVESEPGRGTTVIARIPLNGEPAK